MPSHSGADASASRNSPAAPPPRCRTKTVNGRAGRHVGRLENHVANYCQCNCAISRLAQHLGPPCFSCLADPISHAAPSRMCMYVYVSVRAHQRHPDRGTGDKPRGRKRLGWPCRQRRVKMERSAKGKGTFRVTSASRAQTLRHLAEACIRTSAHIKA